MNPSLSNDYGRGDCGAGRRRVGGETGTAAAAFPPLHTLISTLRLKGVSSRRGIYQAIMSWRVRVWLLLIGCTLEVLGLGQEDRVKRFMTAESFNGRSQLIENITKLRVERQLVEEPSRNDSAFKMVNDADRSASRNAENGKISSNFKITGNKLDKRENNDNALWFLTTPNSYYKYLHGNKRDNRRARPQASSKVNNNHYSTVWDPIQEYPFPVKATKIPQLAEDGPSKTYEIHVNDQPARLQTTTNHAIEADGKQFWKENDKNIIYFYAAEDSVTVNSNDWESINKYPLHSITRTTKIPHSSSPRDHRRLKRQKFNTQGKTNAAKLHHKDAGTMDIQIHKEQKKLPLDDSVMQRKIDKLNSIKLLTEEALNLRSDLTEQAFLSTYKLNELKHGKKSMPHKRNDANRFAIQQYEDNMNRKQSRSYKLLLGEEAIAREHAKLVHDINSLLEYTGWSGLKTTETTTELIDEDDSIYVEDLETRTQPPVISTAAPRSPSVNVKIVPKTGPGKTPAGKPVAVALPLIVVGGDTTNQLVKPTTHPYPFVGAASTSFPMRLRPVMYSYPVRSKPTLWQRFVALFPRLVR